MKTPLLNLVKLFALIGILTCIVNREANAQVIKTESFDGTTFTPAGWSLDPIIGNPIWVRRTNGPAGNQTLIMPHSGAAMARFSISLTTTGTQQALITPVIDYSQTNGATPTFSMYMYRDSLSTAGDSITVLVNTAPSVVGATRLGAVARSRYYNLPTYVLDNGWYLYTFNIPANFNTSTNYIIINGTSQGGSNMFIDDVQWDEYPTQCSGQPTAGTIASTASLICGGSGSADLTLSGGSSGFAGITYQWESTTDSVNGPWTAFGTSTNSVNTGTLTATTYFRCFVTCTASGLADSAYYSITVNPNPNPTVTTTPTSPIVACAGSTVTITANGANTYSWSPATALNTTTGSTVESTPTAPVTYTIIGTDAFGCTGTRTVTVNVSNAPNFTLSANRPSVCDGDTTLLRAITQGGGPGGFGTQYTWSTGATGNATIVTVNGPTTYTVVGTNQAGCTRTDSITVNTVPGVNPNFGYTANNQTVTFADSSNGAISWLWLFGDGNASFSQNPTYSYSASGTYNVTLIVSNGVCAADTIVKTITVQMTGLANNASSIGMSIYPNPVADMATVQFASHESIATISVINAIGQVVYTKQANSSNGNKFNESIDFSQLAAGIYSVKVLTASETGVMQIVK
ncbi:MAG: T9SS type A sorting domain-containing protein [Bacteroidota bacterium]